MLSKTMMLALADYNRWANDRVLTAAARVDETTLAAPVGLGHGSVRDALFHMLRTEWVWCTLCQKQQIQPAELPRPEQFNSVARLQARWTIDAAEMRRYIGGLDETDLAATVMIGRGDGSTTPMVIWRMLLHAFLHSMQHRSEVAAVLTEAGHSVGDIDFIFFAAADRLPD